MEDGLVKVVSPIEDTPAYRAGIKSGDLIFKLDDTPVKGMTLNDAVKTHARQAEDPDQAHDPAQGRNQAARDHADARSHQGAERQVEAGRTRLRLRARHPVPGKHRRRPGQASERALQAGQRCKGLVLDLRNDPGGLLNGAIGVSAAFLPPDALVVSTDGRTADAKQEFFARPQDYLRGTPRRSAARACRPTSRRCRWWCWSTAARPRPRKSSPARCRTTSARVVMGTQTFGKGSVQTILPLPGNTAIKLTTARYYTPNGRSIQAKGIVPDIIVEETPNGDSGAARLREADLEHHLEQRPREGRRPRKPPKAARQDAGQTGQATRTRAARTIPTRTCRPGWNYAARTTTSSTRRSTFSRACRSCRTSRSKALHRER